MFSEAWLDCNLNQQLMSIPRPNIEISIPVPFCSSLVASGLSHPLSCTQTEIILKRQTYFELQMWCLCLSFLWLTMSCFFPTNPFCSSFSAPPQTNNVHPDGSVTSSRLRFQVFVELSVSVFLRAAVFFESRALFTRLRFQFQSVNGS